MNSTPRRVGFGTVSSLFIVLILTSSGFAQFSWDAPRKNLQVLPDTISAGDLRATMRAFTSALGVRCSYCHDDSQGHDLDLMDFASDAKPEKEVARLMMRMTQMINADFVSKVSHGGHPDLPAIPVTCVTCHRGENRPLPLEDALLMTIKSHGSEAGRQKYRELRDEYYGRMAYDFSGRALARLGRTLERDGMTEEAIDVYRLAVEMHPDTWHAYDNLANAYLARGDTVRAITFWQKCLEVDPGLDRVAERLAELR